MADSLLFLTELMGMKVYDLKGRRIGRVRDAGLLPRVDKVRIDQFLVGGEWNWWSVRHDQVASISLDGISLRDEQLVPYHDDVWMLRMARDLLDQQIIDAKGRKVVRDNDVTFELKRANAHDELRVLERRIGEILLFRDGSRSRKRAHVPSLTRMGRRSVYDGNRRCPPARPS